MEFGHLVLTQRVKAILSIFTAAIDEKIGTPCWIIKKVEKMYEKIIDIFIIFFRRYFRRMSSFCLIPMILRKVSIFSSIAKVKTF